jgi:D-alanine-D-alanine ligase
VSARATLDDATGDAIVRSAALDIEASMRSTEIESAVMKGQEDMRFGDRRTDLPVLLLHNVDPKWRKRERTEAHDAATTLETSLRGEGHPVTTITIDKPYLESLIDGHDPERVVVFNWCEELPGMPRSEPLVAYSLERLGFSFTGAPGDALATAWDKPRVKQLLERQRVPTPPWRVFTAPDVDGWDRFPAIVKLAYEHCSLGVGTGAVVMSPDQLKARIGQTLDEYGEPVLVEEFIDGREFHVTVWGNGTLHMLPPAEMSFGAFDDVRDRLCTFDSKFSPASRHYKEIKLELPARLSPEEHAQLERAVTGAFWAVGCRDYARIDVRLRDGVFYVLDVNPNSDMTAETSTAYAAEAAGYSYGALASQIVNFAAQRHPVFA